MRKWKCVSVNNGNSDIFTVGKIYETDDRMLNCKVDSGYVLTNVPIFEKRDAGIGLVFEEVFEEGENKMMDIKGKRIAVLCDTREKINSLYKVLKEKVDNSIFNCDNPSKLYIGYIDYDSYLTWDSQNYFQNKNYKLITFEEFIGEVKEGGKKVNKFKVGDKVRIIARKSGHRFKIGDIVELYEKSYDGDFRGMKEGDGRDWGNWIRREDMELIKENKSSIKTLTITTSDSTTTLTDGVITVSVNRYYTDKHDEEIAVNEVVNKYYDELYEIDRVSKEKHLFDDETNYDYGVIGTPTILTDSIGRKLFIGDVVKVYNKDGSDNGFMDLVCHDDKDGDFIMGCACATSNNSKKEYNYLKEMSYGDISNDNKIWASCLVIK